MPTTKELLESIIKQQEVSAKNQLDFAAKVSTFMNKQEGINTKFLGYLESNHKTKQVGVVEQVELNKQNIAKIQTERKITAGKITVIVAVLTFIGGLILKVIGAFNK
jgi:hypothetical protein